jgi:hypothetical protein
VTDPSWFVSREISKSEIALPSVELRDKKLKQLREDGNTDDAIEAERERLTGWVELRPLNAGHVAQMNELKLKSDGASIDLGAAKVLAVEFALVNWSLPSPITVDTIKQLNPMVFEQIYELVDGGEGANGSGPPPPAAETPHTPKDAADSS